MEEIFTAIIESDRVVIPERVCQRLGLKAGDVVRFRVSGDRVTIEKLRETEDDPFVLFSEWASVEDQTLYRDL